MHSKYDIEAKVKCYGLFGSDSSYASTTNQTSVSTNTFTNAFNQSLTRVQNLSDVGNVSLNVDSPKNSTSSIFVMLGIGVLAFMFIKKKL